MTQNNGAENAAALWLVLGVAAFAGAILVNEWIAYAFVLVTVVGVVGYFLLGLAELFRGR